MCEMGASFGWMRMTGPIRSQRRSCAPACVGAPISADNITLID
jgi:hypothetical protein